VAANTRLARTFGGIATYHLDTFLVTVLASDLISAICIFIADHGGRRCEMTSITTFLIKQCDYLVRYSLADASICEERMSCSVACR